jgi:hypothetical protein
LFVIESDNFSKKASLVLDGLFDFWSAIKLIYVVNGFMPKHGKYEGGDRPKVTSVQVEMIPRIDGVFV